MKSNLIKNFLLMILLFSIKVSSQTTSFTESGFSADFPEKPIVETSEVGSKIGIIKNIRYTYGSDECIIIVSQNTYSKELFEKLGKTGQKGVLDGSKKGSIKNIEAEMGDTFTKEKDTDFLYNDKYVANKFSGTIADLEMSATSIIKENYLYSIIIIGDTNADAALNFTKSFKLID